MSRRIVGGDTMPADDTRKGLTVRMHPESGPGMMWNRGTGGLRLRYDVLGVRSMMNPGAEGSSARCGREGVLVADSQRTVVLVVVVAFLVLVGLPLLWGSLMMGGSMMGPGMMGPMMGGWWAGGNPWWGILSFIFGAVALVGIALLVIWAVRQFGPGEAGSQQPLEILRERYARGDITRAQYEQMRSDLE